MSNKLAATGYTAPGSLGAVWLYSPDGKVPTALREAVDVRYSIEVRRTYVDIPAQAWDTTVGLVTTSGLSAKVERQAARFGTMAYVLPEAAGELARKITQRMDEAGAALVINYHKE